MRRHIGSCINPSTRQPVIRPIEYTCRSTAMPHSQTQEHLQTGMNTTLEAMLPRLVIGLIVYYLVAPIAHIWLFENSLRDALVTLGLATACLLTITYGLLRRRLLAHIDANIIATIITIIPLGNTLITMYLTQDIYQSTFVAILVIGIGCFSTSRRWQIIASSIVLVGWIFTVRLVPTQSLLYFSFMMLQAIGISALIFIVRFHDIRASTITRLRTEKQNHRLALINDALLQARVNAESERQAADQARSTADRANDAKRMFLAHMTHELRTPLTAMLGYCELLEMSIRQRGQDDLISDLDNIRLAGNHLKEIVNSVLDMSKIESGHFELLPNEIVVPHIVEYVIKSVQPIATSNENQLRATIAPELPILVADDMRVRQILINLLSNACRFTFQGSITLNVDIITHYPLDESTEQDWFVFEIADTGMGMSAEQMERLFQDYAQVGTSRSIEQHGTGLGLALSKRLALLMGGDIRVRSALGKGSIFSVYLPLVKQAYAMEVSS
jgi:signal transduction histidine kinase